MMLGLQTGVVRLVPHSEEWGGLFKEEAARIATCLQGKVFDIEHVGSTAVPGIPAKPIIDIAVGIPDFAVIMNLVRLLEQIGYEYRGDRFGDGNHIFAKGPASSRTHHLHVVALGGPKWRNYALFRDYLRSHEGTRGEYAALKRRLAEQYPFDRDSYTQGKHEFIRRTIEIARDELLGR